MTTASAPDPAGGPRPDDADEVHHRCAVLGHPVSHSLSPLLHGAAYRALGLEGWRYTAVDVEQSGLAAFLDSRDATWRGLSLTMPHKQVVLPLLDEVDETASAVGAVNTVLLGERRTGTNTDVRGIVAALLEGFGAGPAGEVPAGGVPAGEVVVLGAGATAASTLAALRGLGLTEPLVLVRSPGRTGELAAVAERLGVVPRFGLLTDAARVVLDRSPVVLVSTLPPHAADGVAGELRGAADAGARLAAGPHVALDVAYVPRRTALGAAWEALGGASVPGERMLLHQAADQVRLMTGRPAPLAAMDAALGCALGA